MKIVINPEFDSLSKEINSLPFKFTQEGESIYLDKNVLKVFNFQNQEVVVKSFKIPHFINKIAYTFFRPSKARRSYEHALRLLAKNINTPLPVAYIERKQTGLLHDSYYACLNLKYDGMLRELRTGKLEGREDFLRQFARFTAHMHEQQVLHLDYSPGNILYTKSSDKKEYEFYLVDINRMVFKPVNMESGCRGLRRLWGSDEMFACIVAEYALARGFDQEECLALAMKYRIQFWEQFGRRHNGAKPYLGENA